MMFMYDWNRITWRYNSEQKDDKKPQEQPQPEPQPNEDLEYLETRITRWENPDD